jgi:hypothetical protein
MRLRERFGGHDSTRRWPDGVLGTVLEGWNWKETASLTLSSKREFEMRKSED